MISQEQINFATYSDCILYHCFSAFRLFRCKPQALELITIDNNTRTKIIIRTISNKGASGKLQYIADNKVGQAVKEELLKAFPALEVKYDNE